MLAAATAGANGDSDDEANAARRDPNKPKVPVSGAADDDDEIVPPPPLEKPTSDASAAEDDYDPNYNAPYLPQNLPELPDSDNEGASEEDESIGASKPAATANGNGVPTKGKKPLRAATGPITSSMGVVISNTKPGSKALPAPPSKKLPPTPGTINH